MKCEFCPEEYKDGLWDEHYWFVEVFDKKHYLCDCCKKRLKKVVGVKKP